jgi:hypothetical protein
VLAALELVLILYLPLQPVELGLHLLVALRLVLLAILAHLTKLLLILALASSLLALSGLAQIHQEGLVLDLFHLVQIYLLFWHL